MATRLFFHAASNALTGTFPTGEQSSVSSTWLVSTGNTLRTMNSLTGTAQASLVGSTTGTTALQNGFCGFFCSNTFDVGQNVGGGGQTVTLNIANSETSTNVNIGTGLKFNIYVWRPSTGAVVGVVGDNLTLTGIAEPGAAASERVNNGTNAATTQVAALAGDVLICEVWQIHTQANASPFGCTFFYDGTTVNTTTNATVTNHASFLNFSSDTLTFGTPASTFSGAFSNTLATIALSAAGNLPVVGTFGNTLATVALSGAGAVPHTSTFTNTLGTVTLSAAGLVGVALGSFNNTLDVATVAGTGTAPHVGTFNNTLATIQLSGVGAVPSAGTFGGTLERAVLSGVGTVGAPAAAEGTFDSTLARATLDARGTAGFPTPPLPRPTSSAGSGGAQTGKRKKFRLPELVALASPVDALFDHPPPAVPPRADEMSPEKVVKYNTLMLDSLIANAPQTVPLPEPAPQAILEPEDDTDELMMLFALLV